VADRVDSRVQVLIAEYEFVTGLIKYYRDVELRALAGTGIVLTAVAAAVAALEAAHTPNRLAESLLLAIAAWVPVVLLMIVIMAKTRGMRAVVYVRDGLRVRAGELTGDRELLQWETHATPLLDDFLPKALEGHWSGHVPEGFRRATIVSLLRGTPIIVAITFSSVALASAGAWIGLVAEGWVTETTVAVVVGGAAAVVAVLSALVGIGFTNRTDVSTQPD
jgi:FtsH-binding integral membrane protein